MCATILEVESQHIRGVDIIVEIDESKFGKRISLLENMFYCIKLCSILTVYLVVALPHSILMVYSLMLFNIQK